MADNNTIKKYTAADIEKYWNKKLSPAEMREMEKAAMDDPFFADALEGYKNSMNSADELSALTTRFEKKLNEPAPVIPLHTKKYSWLRIAAAIIVLAGAGFLVQQLAFKNNSGTALSKIQTPVVSTDNKQADNKNEVAPQAITDTITSGSLSTQQTTNKPAKTEAATSDLNSSFALITIDSLKTDDKVFSDTKDKNVDTSLNAIASVNKAVEKKETIDERRDVAGNISTPKANSGFDRETEAKRKAFSDDYYKQSGLLNNRFNYRVVDAQNNPVPFANVMNTRDNIGTYTDVRGYFNLVSSDSVMDVQVRSLGYNSENYRLVPSKQPNNLVLQEDATARNQMLINQRGGRVMSSVSRKDSAEVEEPEAGWGNYNTYVENNIKIPENVRAKNALNEVELSFDVDKSGQPINIKVTKSSQCKECDEEAKRLLKEGPKWKRKGKKYKTTISISVDQK